MLTEMSKPDLDQSNGHFELVNTGATNAIIYAFNCWKGHIIPSIIPPLLLMLLRVKTKH